jgi:hypothetical protein
MPRSWFLNTTLPKKELWLLEGMAEPRARTGKIQDGNKSETV